MPEKQEYPTVTVRGTVLGAGANCKVIVPITPSRKNPDDAAAKARALKGGEGDLAELRLDALLPCDTAALCDCAKAVRAALDETKPLLATIRTAREGGPAACTVEEYAALCVALCQSGAIDMIDVELSAAECSDAAIAAVTAAAKAANVVTVFSCHDFAGTPAVEEMAATLCRMGELGADIAKLAVMPHSPADAAALLRATADAAAALPHTPLITMAMGQYGAITRVCGCAFGSCATFGTAGEASAPGQPDSAALRAALDAVQACL